MTMTKTTVLSLLTASLVTLPLAAAAQTAGGGSGGGSRNIVRQTPSPTTPPRQQPRAQGGADQGRLSPQGFSVVLVLGDLQGGATSDNVPAAARKALADMKDFLPYKSYRLLDVQWTLCCSRGPNTSVVSRLRGADGQDYELSLAASVDSRDRIGVRFLLREPAARTGQADAGSEVVVQLQREVSRLEQQLEAATKTARTRAEVGVGGPVEEDRTIHELRSKLAEMKIRLAETRRDQRAAAPARSVKSTHSSSVIDTSFTMDVGETVVVGTSRVAGGEKALIALLTAVAQNR
jgi:hypothetical protein